MDIRERKILSPDLDIFGDENESVTGTDWEEREMEDLDIFGGLWDQPTDAKDETSTEDSTETDATTSEGDTKTETNEWEDEEKTDEELKLDKLFDDAEAEAKQTWNVDLQNMIDELRNQLTDTLADNKIKDKQLEVLNEKLMGKTWEDTWMSMYKWLIDKLEANPKILMLAKFWWDVENPKIKQKMVNILADSLYELTGQDVSDLIDQSQADKIVAATGWSSSSESPSFKEKKEDTENMDYEQSINDLF